MADELFTAPSDLTLSSDADLAELETRAVAEFERVSAIDNVDPDALAYAMRLTDDLDRIRGELRVREVRALFPGAKASLAASAGAFLGPEYRYDMVRAGISLRLR